MQEYARKLSKIKSRTKLSRRSRDASSSAEGTPEVAVKTKISSPLVENFDDVVDDISQATTPKAKSSLLQKKLAENRKIFQQRSKEMTENKRAVEEKVEAIRQQLDESDTTISELHKELATVLPVQPVVITTQVMYIFVKWNRSFFGGEFVLTCFVDSGHQQPYLATLQSARQGQQNS